MKKTSIILVISFAAVLTSCQGARIEKETKPSIQVNIIETTKKDATEETTEEIDNFFYKDVTSLGKKEVEEIAKKIKELYIKGDFESISKKMDYPIYFDKKEKDFTFRVGGQKVNNEKEFMDCVKNLKVSDSSIEEMKKETCENMFAQPSSGGICFGDGVIWIRDINYDGRMMTTNGTPTFKIFALSGLE